MNKLKVSIVGASGYAGGELLRLLLYHPHVEVQQVTSERYAGKFVKMIHPNLRPKDAITFCSVKELKPCEVLFLCLPHGVTMAKIMDFKQLAPKIIDLSGDFRLKNMVQ